MVVAIEDDFKQILLDWIVLEEHLQPIMESLIRANQDAEQKSLLSTAELETFLVKIKRIKIENVTNAKQQSKKTPIQSNEKQKQSSLYISSF